MNCENYEKAYDQVLPGMEACRNCKNFEPKEPTPPMIPLGTLVVVKIGVDINRTVELWYVKHGIVDQPQGPYIIKNLLTKRTMTVGRSEIEPVAVHRLGDDGTLSYPFGEVTPVTLKTLFEEE